MEVNRIQAALAATKKADDSTASFYRDEDLESKSARAHWNSVYNSEFYSLIKNPASRGGSGQ